MIPRIIDNDSSIYIIVESETSALVLLDELISIVNIVAIGDEKFKPDVTLIDLLNKSNLVLVALDSDKNEQGAKKAIQYWLPKLNRAIFLPPIGGENVLEMLKNGIRLEDWIDIGVEEGVEKFGSVLLKDSTSKFKPYHIETVKKYSQHPPANKKYELISTYLTEELAFKAMARDKNKNKKHKIKSVANNCIYDTEIKNEEKKYTISQLRGAWAAGKNSR